MNLDYLLQFDHVLLLQGPVGPFFSHLAHFLHSKKPQQSITKIHFCLGDSIFYHAPPSSTTTSFTEPPPQFPQFLTRLLLQNPRQKTAIVLFGDCRPYHIMAHDTLQTLQTQNIHPHSKIVTFEEGYIRPYFYTMELGRVNGFSTPILPPKQTDTPHIPPPPLPPTTFSPSFAKKAMIGYGAVYALVNTLGNPRRYPFYKSWRDMPIGHTSWKALSFVLKYKLLQKNALTNKKVQQWAAAHPQQYFIVGLQLAHDSQIKHHSDISQETFLSRTLRAFAAFGPPTHHLIIKAHPLDIDPGYWHTQIIEQIYDLGIQSRVHFVTHTPHTSALLQNASGLLCINSTLGIEALSLGIPVLPAGRCIYAIPELTPIKDMPLFFQQPQPPDPSIWQQWVSVLLARNQIPGNVYLPHSLLAPAPYTLHPADSRPPHSAL